MRRFFLVVPLVIVTFASTYLAQETCKRHVEPTGGFSFCPPVGWSIEDSPESTFKIMLGPRSDDFTPNILATKLDVSVPLSDIVSITIKHYSEHAKDLGVAYIKVLKQEEFTTLSKQQGVKVVFQSENKNFLLRTTQYFFGEKGDSKLIITFTSLDKQSDVLDPIFDQSMKTLRSACNPP